MTIKARRATFANCPKIFEDKVEQLIEAGFYYTGKGVQVQCFSCGVLKDWNYEDDPWEQHANFEKCEHFQLWTIEN